MAEASLPRPLEEGHGVAEAGAVGELRKIGVDIAKSAVETYMVRKRGPASPTWKSFLRNQRDLVSADFFVVPTVRFGLLWVFLLVATERRRVVHFNVTDDPTSEWAARQVVQAFPYETAPRFLLRDRDQVYGKEFSRKVKALGIEEVRTAYRSPWQNGYVERLIGTIRRDCVDHVIVRNERHLKRVLRDYLGYYHRWRTHLSLEMDAPERRPVQETGRIVEVEELGGLHHHYERMAA
jgi:transposase InsO family protein